MGNGEANRDTGKGGGIFHLFLREGLWEATGSCWWRNAIRCYPQALSQRRLISHLFSFSVCYSGVFLSWFPEDCLQIKPQYKKACFFIPQNVLFQNSNEDTVIT